MFKCDVNTDASTYIHNVHIRHDPDKYAMRCVQARFCTQYLHI